MARHIGKVQWLCARTGDFGREEPKFCSGRRRSIRGRFDEGMRTAICSGTCRGWSSVPPSQNQPDHGVCIVWTPQGSHVMMSSRGHIARAVVPTLPLSFASSSPLSLISSPKTRLTRITSRSTKITAWPRRISRKPDSRLLGPILVVPFQDPPIAKMVVGP